MQTSMLFHPQPLAFNIPETKRIKEIEIEASGNVILRGWTHGKPAKAKQLVIYFGGNAEEVSHLLTYAKRFEGTVFVLVNYPGYGASTGKPSEESFYDAALAIYDFTQKAATLKDLPVIAFGRSIGTAPATYLAAYRNVEKVILISPFESIRKVAKSKFPILPVSLLLRHHFDADKYARKTEAPLLSFYGSADRIIPPKHSKNLTSAWKGESTLVELSGFDHNDIFAAEKMWQRIESFLAE